MTSAMPLIEIGTEATITLRAPLLTLARRLVSRALRAIATGIAFLADLLDVSKKEKRLNVVRC
jgi:hypothetical protein